MKRGDKFTHAIWRTADLQPLRCRVTAVRRGRVYWREDDDGTKAEFWFGLDEVERHVKIAEAEAGS